MLPWSTVIAWTELLAHMPHKSSELESSKKASFVYFIHKIVRERSKFVKVELHSEIFDLPMEIK